MHNVTTSRPSHLPDFTSPPLSEVYLGVQFAPPNGYKQILAGNVWELYRKDYPKVLEQPALEPTFETFGLPFAPNANQFKFLTGAAHDRFWFLSENEQELIQFQQDRLLHNWREVVNPTETYPRFESMISKFKNELEILDVYMKSLSTQPLMINQFEVSYINHIHISEDPSFKPDKWLNFINFSKMDPENFNVSLREIFYSDANKPAGRLIIEAVTATDIKNQNIIRLTLTARGAPLESTIDSALESLTNGRNIIVSKFADITTEFAHKTWGRLK